MANWASVISLVTIVTGVDGSGFPTKERQTRSGIYANELSVRSNEYYMAKQSGINLEKMFGVRSIEYQGEESLEHEGKQYNITRTYDKGEFTELVCEKKE